MTEHEHSSDSDEVEEITSVELIEHRVKEQPKSLEEKKPVLLPGGPREDDIYLTDFTDQAAIFPRRDGRLGRMPACCFCGGCQWESTSMGRSLPVVSAVPSVWTWFR